MNFETRAQEATYRDVRDWLEEMVGGAGSFHPEEPAVFLSYGSTELLIAVRAWGDDEALIGMRAFVVADAKVDQATAMFLLQENTENNFGAYGVTPSGDIVLDHALVGSSCSRDELGLAMDILVRQADAIDNQLAQRTGGKTAADSMGDG